MLLHTPPCGGYVVLQITLKWIPEVHQIREMVQMLQYVSETGKILMRSFCVVSEKKAQTADLLEL